MFEDWQILLANAVIWQHTVRVTRIWNWSDCSVLGHFVKQKFCLFELWNLLSFRMCSKTYLTHRLWEIWNPSTQSHEIAIWRNQDWKTFAWFLAISLKIKKKCFNLAPFELQFLIIGLMYFEFLKACGSGRLWSTF